MKKEFAIRVVIYALIIIGMTSMALYDLHSMQQREAAAIGSIGGADGPTAIFITSKVAPWTGIVAVISIVLMALAIHLYHKKHRR